MRRKQEPSAKKFKRTDCAEEALMTLKAIFRATPSRLSRESRLVLISGRLRRVSDVKLSASFRYLSGSEPYGGFRNMRSLLGQTVCYR